jgi:hypothetical protein
MLPGPFIRSPNQQDCSSTAQAPIGALRDPARLKTTYVPGDVSFSTKLQLAAEMIERALAAGVPFLGVPLPIAALVRDSI